MDKANVRVLEETADRLHDRKARGETYDDVIQRLLDAVEGEQELIADGGVSVEAADEDGELDIDDWASANLVNIRGDKRDNLIEVERDRRAAVERAEEARAEARRLRRQNRQLEARPSTSLDVAGQTFGPAGVATIGTAIFLAGVGVGVGVE